MLLVDKYFLRHFNKKKLPHQQHFWKLLADARLLAVVLYGLPALYLFFFTGTWRSIFDMSISVIMSIGIGYGLKAIILRPRPHNHVTYLGKFDSSFPSLHSFCAFNLALLLSVYFPQLTVFWYSYAFFVGLARIFVQVHYFSDVVGGALLGSVLAWGLLNIL